MVLRRAAATLVAPCAVLTAAGAEAQTPSAALVGPAEPAPFAEPARPGLPSFRLPSGDLRMPGDVRRNGLIAAYPIRDNVHVAIGRFMVPELARPRTHMERDRAPTAARPRDRGVAAVGISFRF